MDYKKLGLCVGLEIHQQLASGHKLFCRCPITKSEEFPNTTVRRLRPVAGELGDVDPAALFEFFRNRQFHYKTNTESSCLVELDDEPPKEMNTEALDITLQICRLLNCNIIDEIQVMRKTVVDGSSVSGFQRTALVGIDGYLETSFGKVGIKTISIEEDSAPAVSRQGGIIEYRLDRSGVPLVEIATSADIHSPEQAKEVAENLGLILRSVSVIRGIGSIRQDINISIADGARIEVKGFQELEKIPKLIENEVARQTALIEIRDELEKRGVKYVKSDITDSTGIFRSSKSNIIQKAVAENKKIYAAILKEFGGLLKKQCGVYTLGKEMSMHAESYGLGIIHTDEIEKFPVLTNEFGELRKLLKAEARDVVFIVIGQNPEKAVKAVLERAGQCLLGVPKETRIADENMGSKYTRPLPGSQRMYPESDIPPIRIKDKNIEIPKTLLEKMSELEKEMSEDLTKQLIKSRDYALFEELRSKFSIEPKIIATTLLSTIKDLRRQNLDTSRITKTELEKIFDAVDKNRISKDSILKILEMVCRGQDMEALLRSYESLSENKLRELIKKIVAENRDKKESVLMGIVMKEAAGRADGKLVSKILKEEMR
jgi:glutamyl-tRNA(Gln) amidotransferase subunit E